MSTENNRLLGHSDEADGIDEYDNPLPDWWVGLFWFTIVWAIALGYLVWGDLPDRYVVTGIVLVVCSGLYILHREIVVRRQRRAARA